MRPAADISSMLEVAAKAQDRALFILCTAASHLATATNQTGSSGKSVIYDNGDGGCFLSRLDALYPVTAIRREGSIMPASSVAVGYCACNLLRMHYICLHVQHLLKLDGCCCSGGKLFCCR